MAVACAFGAVTRLTASLRRVRASNCLALVKTLYTRCRLAETMTCWCIACEDWDSPSPVCGCAVWALPAAASTRGAAPNNAGSPATPQARARREICVLGMGSYLHRDLGCSCGAGRLRLMLSRLNLKPAVDELLLGSPG